MGSKRKGERNDPAYLREQGSRSAVGKRERNITFSFSKHIQGEGQNIEEWDALGLLGTLLLRIKAVGQHSALDVRRQPMIKEYHKVDFPLNSEFTHPKHIGSVTWAVMHITPMSKEVVVGYLEEDVSTLSFWTRIIGFGQVH